MQRVLGVPLGGVAEDHVVGVQIGAVVELDAGAELAGPDGRVRVGVHSVASDGIELALPISYP